jgi:hypothetical protein
MDGADHVHDARRSAGDQRVIDIAGGQAACIDRVEAVNVLGWINGVEDCVSVDVCRQG